jgi:hypothetical protein
MAEGIMGLMDSMPDTGPPADARDTNSPNFGKGLSTMEVYEILEPLARMVAERTGDPVQVILQEMITDPDSIARAKLMLGMDPTTPFPNNIREPSPDEIQGMRVGTGETVMGIPRDAFNNLSTEQQERILESPRSSAGDIAGIPRDIFNSLTAEQQAGILGSLGSSALARLPAPFISGTTKLFPSATPEIQGIPMTIFEQLNAEEQAKILGMGDTFTNIDLPEGRPTMSERLLSQMSLKD